MIMAKTTSQPAVLESAVWLSKIESDYQEAANAVNKIDREIGEFNTEIDVRLARRADLMVIITRAGPIIEGKPNTAPQLTERKETPAVGEGS